MSGFIPDNRQISAFQTRPGLVARDLRFFRKYKRTVDLAVSSDSSEKRKEGAMEQKVSEIRFNGVLLLKL